ncbi:slipin family protein, partial [Candidatus Woesearchaeota archaeon]|nr:slipin family protein [Candidatus Woesearchaeota archaeon]
MAVLTYAIIVFVILILFWGLRLVYEYQRLVRFRLGKFKDVMNPGLKWVIPIIDKTQRIDLRVNTVDVEPQEAMTADNVPLKVNAVIFYRVLKPSKAILEIEDYEIGVSQFARAALRDAVGKADLDVILSKREKVADEIKKIVDKATDPWGIDVIEVKIQEIELPETMKRAMAKQAEAERERRATIIKSEGEIKAAESLAKAAQILGKEPTAFNLRTLSTITDISSDPSQKIIFVPADIMK